MASGSPPAELSCQTLSQPDTRPTVLHIGDPVQHNPEVYARFSTLFRVIRPSLQERLRPAFIQALKEKKWGDFDAIFRPFWGTGGEMGRWDRELVELLPKSVKVFASAGAGFDWADTEVLGEHGIIYCNSATASTEAVADFAIFGILSVFRNLYWCISAARSSRPTSWLACHDQSTATARNPRGHVLGIIGLGNIGYAIAEKAKAVFGMKIIYYDILRKRTELEEAVGATYYESLPEMLRISDCVVLATPSSPDGSKLISTSILKDFKDGARFVNIARGSLVDSEALADALDSGKLFAAMLDVHEDEPAVHPRLAKMENVMLTCHNAGGTLDTHFGFERLSMENIMGVLAPGGKGPISPVNLHLIK